MKIKQEDGTEVEVFTPEEMEKKLEEKVSETRTQIEGEYTAKIEETNTKLEGLSKTLEDLEREKKELESKINDADANKEGEDHKNFKTLKDALDKKDNEIKELSTSITDIKAQRENDYLSESIKKATAGDEEMEKKVKHHYTETLKAMPNNTVDEIAARIDAAKRLSGVNDSVDVVGSVVNGSSGYFPSGGEKTGVELTANEKALGAKLGLTDEDYKKYGSKLK